MLLQRFYDTDRGMGEYVPVSLTHEPKLLVLIKSFGPKWVKSKGGSKQSNVRDREDQGDGPVQDLAICFT